MSKTIIPKRPNALPQTLAAFILHFMQQQWASFSFMFFNSIVWAANDALYPYFIKVLVDKMTNLTPGLEKPLYLMASPLMGIILLFLVSEIFARFYGIISVYTWPKFRKNIRISLFAYTHGHAHNYFAEHFTGGLANKTAELPRACEVIVTILLNNLFSTLFIFCFSLCVILKTSLIFSLILFCFVTTFISITLVTMHTIKDRSTTHAEAVSTLDGIIVDSLSCILTVRLFARSSYELNYLNSYQAVEIKQAHKAAWAIQKSHAWKALLSFTFITITFGVLVYGWNQKWISIGDVALIATTFFSIMQSVWHSHFHLMQISKEIGISKAALSILSEPHSISNAYNATPLFITAGAIHFNNVTFSYTPNVPVFNQLSVKIEGKQKVGLVGFSGSGKSSFINLILRLHDLLIGEILIDNQNIKNVTQESLREHIAVIPQNPMLFHRTIFENIHYGRLNASEAEVWEAAKLAHCNEFIEQFDKGWQTMVGEHGAKLSGGQRQRIAIARAILKNAPLLIMDEATSALDSVTENFIQKNLKNFMQHCTTLVIAHRLSTLSYMDRILVFHKGSIVEDGTMPELLAKKGHFTNLWEMQAGGLLPEQESR